MVFLCVLFPTKISKHMGQDKLILDHILCNKNQGRASLLSILTTIHLYMFRLWSFTILFNRTIVFYDRDKDKQYPVGLCFRLRLFWPSIRVYYHLTLTKTAPQRLTDNAILLLLFSLFTLVNLDKKKRHLSQMN